VFVTCGASPLGESVLPRLASVHAVWALARSATAAQRVDGGGSHRRMSNWRPAKWAAVCLSTPVRQLGRKLLLAMLRHDRRVSPGGGELIGHPLTTLAEGLAMALARYEAGPHLGDSSDVSHYAGLR
jgi:hypothetical protein